MIKLKIEKRKYIISNPGVEKLFLNLSDTQRKEAVRWIEEAKREEYRVAPRKEHH